MRILTSSKLTILCILFLLTTPETIYTQVESDSLFAVVGDDNQTIKNKLSAYADLVYLYESADPDKAISLGREGVALPNSDADTLINDLARIYVNIAFVYYSAQEYEKAIPEFNEAATLYQKADEITKEGVQYNNIGIMHRKLGNYSESINYQRKGLEKLEKAGDLKGVTNIYFNIGNIYIFQKHPELALPYYKKAYKMAYTQNDSVLIADANNSLANGFDHLNEKDSALYYYLKAIDGYAKHNRWVKKAKSEHNVALIYLGKKNYTEAEKMLVSSLNVFRQAPSSMEIEKATVQMGLARVYEATNRQALATKNFEEALGVFRKRGAKTEEKQVLSFMSGLLAKQGLYKEAYEKQSDYIIMKDSIQNSEITSKVLELTEKYEAKKKQNKILALQNKNEIAKREEWFVISLSIGILSILIIAFILYYQRRMKEIEEFKAKLKQSAKELDILRHNIANGATQYLLPCKYSLSRNDVNTYLKEALSERELDVFMLLLKGITNRDIAEKLFVSVNTVKFHLQNIYVKLDVDNRTDAILSVSEKEPSEKRALA